jgi:hypothetical protein
MEFPKNFCVIDLESTGLPDKRTPVESIGVLEVGAVDAHGRRFYRRVAMARGRIVQQGALECNGIDPLDLGVGVSIEEALCDLFAWLAADGYSGRWILGGKNPQYDYSLLNANWPEGTIGVPLHESISRRCVDLHSLAYGMALRSGWDMSADDFSTDDLYRSLGMEPEPKPHNALRGALYEMEGFRRVLLGASAAMPQGQFDVLMKATARENLIDVVERGLDGRQKLNAAHGSVRQAEEVAV